MFKKLNPLDEYRQQLQKVVQKLPADWRKHFFVKYKEYDTAAGKTFVENVVAQRSSDILVLNSLRKLLRWNNRQLQRKNRVNA